MTGPNDEGIGFYYLGNLSSLPDRFINTRMNNDSGESVNVVRMESMLDKPIEPRLYKYLQAASWWQGYSLILGFVCSYSDNSPIVLQ